MEGSEDGKTSTAMEVNLLNVARSSIGELRQDFDDYLKSRHLPIWTRADERFQPMQDFTKQHNLLSDYEPYFQQWTAEEMANVGLTLCYQVDAMMNKWRDEADIQYTAEGQALLDEAAAANEASEETVAATDATEEALADETEAQPADGQ